jgi:hypothetical protein
MSGDFTLERLRAIGGLVSASTETHVIAWRGVDENTGEPTTFDLSIEVKRMAFGWITRTMRETRSLANGHDEQRLVEAALISGGVRINGLALSYDEALQLEPNLANECLRLFTLVNPIRSADSEASPKN